MLYWMRALDLDEIDEGVNLACAGAVRKRHSDAIKILLYKRWTVKP